MVYLLRLSQPLGNERHSAQFYMGWTLDRPGHLELRLSQHRRGVGAKFTAEAVRRGYTMEVVMTWPKGDRALERKLKRRHNHRKLLRAQA